MNSRFSAGVAGVALLALVSAPAAIATPPVLGPFDVSATVSPVSPASEVSPASAYGYTFEREWLYTANVANDVRGMVASPKDEVFVVGDDRKVRRYDLRGTLKATWELPAASSPDVLAVDPRNGQLHISDWGAVGGRAGRIMVYSRDGQPLREYATPTEYMWASGLAIDTDGRAYVANAHDDRISRFSPSGVHEGSFGGTGTGPVEFDHPGGLAVGKDGTLYISDLMNERVQQLRKDGTFVRQWGQAGEANGQFMRPNNIVVTASGNLLVTDVFSRRVQEFTPRGGHVRTFGADYLRDNRALSIDRHGAVYVGGYLDSLVEGVAKFKPAAPTGKTTKVTAKAKKKTYGKTSKVAVTVSNKATGKVRVTAGKKTVTGTLKKGKVTVRLPKTALKPGNRKITVRYAGVAGKFRPSSTTAKVRVLKAKPKIQAKAKKKSVKRGKTATFRITVTAPGTKVKGKVTVKASGAKSKTVKLNSKGRANVKLKFSKKAKTGKRSIKITYRGSSLVKKTTVTKKKAITVRR